MKKYECTTCDEPICGLFCLIDRNKCLCVKFYENNNKTKNHCHIELSIIHTTKQVLKKLSRNKSNILYGIVIYFRGISGFSHLRARDVMSSVNGHHILLTTQCAITKLKKLSRNKSNQTADLVLNQT
jgi:hypothetical protein